MEPDLHEPGPPKGKARPSKKARDRKKHKGSSAHNTSFAGRPLLSTVSYLPDLCINIVNSTESCIFPKQNKNLVAACGKLAQDLALSLQTKIVMSAC